jgi:hypothetical protein
MKENPTKMVPCTKTDLNTTTPGHFCKRDGVDHDLPTMKTVASCGCTVLFCAACMEDRWIVDGKERDIHWWVEQYGKSHARPERPCASRTTK